LRLLPTRVGAESAAQKTSRRRPSTRTGGVHRLAQPMQFLAGSRSCRRYWREHGVFAAHNGQKPALASPIYGFDEHLASPSGPVTCRRIFYDLHASDLTMRWHRAIGKPSCELLTSSSPNQAHLSVPFTAWQVSAGQRQANGCDVLGPCCVGAYPDTTTRSAFWKTVRKGLDFFMKTRICMRTPRLRPRWRSCSRGRHASISGKAAWTGRRTGRMVARAHRGTHSV